MFTHFNFKSLATVLLVTATVSAQPPDQRRGEDRVFGGPPGFQLAAVIDSDRNGKISAKELDNATTALLTLDKNNDGKLSGEEIGWPPPSGFGGFPGFGGPDGPPGGFGGRGGRGGRGGSRFGGFGSEQQGPSRRPNPESESSLRSSPSPDSGQSTRARESTRRRSFFSVEQLKSTDRNQDGVITTAEIPRLLRDSILGRLDTNKDGTIDQAELKTLAKQQEELAKQQTEHP